MNISFCRMVLVLGACVLLSLTSFVQAEQATASTATVDEDGTIHTPNGILPLSPFISPEARKEMTTWLQQQVAAGGAETIGAFTQCGVEPHYWDPDVLLAVRACMLEKWKLPEKVAKLRRKYNVDIETQTIGGIHVDIVTPREGVSGQNKERLLINIHGSGFFFDHPDMRKLAAIPMAALGKIKVAGVDYRMAPEAKHPAALEDVAAVYRELLKQYRPENMGIYGCSAGAVATSWSMVWFQQQGLPMPGAISLNGETGVWPYKAGDSAYYNGAFMGRPYKEKIVRPSQRKYEHYYFSEMEDNDDIMADTSFEKLAKFPPTLLINSTRDSTLSQAIYLHRQLTRAGVDANLQVWEGLPHCFHNAFPDIPESREAYRQMVTFFDEHLGKKELSE